MITQDHGTRQLRKRPGKHYFGDELVSFIADWLNQHGHSAAGKRVAQFIERTNKLWDSANLMGSTPKEIGKKQAIAADLQDMIWAEVSYWHSKGQPWFGQMVVDTHRKAATHILWQPVVLSDFAGTKPGTVLSAFIWLASQGLRNRIGRCQTCSRWMFLKVAGKKRKQSFCSHACRQAHYAQNPEFQKERAKYMRKWRGRQKQKQASEAGF
jgi:hypothetical protein